MNRTQRITENWSIKTALNYAYLGLFLFFLIFPIVIVIILSFSSATFLNFPPPALSFRWYWSLLARRDWLEAAAVSLGVGLGVVLIATPLGTIAAFGFVRSKFSGKTAIFGLVLAPLIVPGIISAIGMYSAYARIGINGSLWGLVIAHTCLALPFVVITVCASLSGYDRRLEWAAMNLGASEWNTFWQVTFPIIRPGIAAGAFLGFLTSFDEVVINLFIGNSTMPTLPRKIWDSIQFDIDPTIAAVSSALILLTAAILIIVELASVPKYRRRPK